MSNTSQAFWILSMILGGVLGMILSWATTRSKVAYKREQSLKSAQMMLTKCYEALAVLDDDETPVEVLDIAVRFAKLIQDPATPKAIAYLLSKNPDAFRSDKKNSVNRDYINEMRPELQEAFAISTVAGMAAFLGRWPECRGAFERLLVEFAASPVREAEQVLETTGKAISYLKATNVALA
jgi:hypothetical protein